MWDTTYLQMRFHLLICAFTLLLVSQKPPTICHAERSAGKRTTTSCCFFQQLVEKKAKQDRLNNFQWIKGKKKWWCVLRRKQSSCVLCPNFWRGLEVLVSEQKATSPRRKKTHILCPLPVAWKPWRGRGRWVDFPSWLKNVFWSTTDT